MGMDNKLIDVLHEEKLKEAKKIQTSIK